jgi:hypothetical protein
LVISVSATAREAVTRYQVALTVVVWDKSATVTPAACQDQAAQF